MFFIIDFGDVFDEAALGAAMLVKLLVTVILLSIPFLFLSQGGSSGIAASFLGITIATGIINILALILSIKDIVKKDKKRIMGIAFLIVFVILSFLGYINHTTIFYVTISKIPGMLLLSSVASIIYGFIHEFEKYDNNFIKKFILQLINYIAKIAIITYSIVMICLFIGFIIFMIHSNNEGTLSEKMVEGADKVLNYFDNVYPYNNTSFDDKRSELPLDYEAIEYFMKNVNKDLTDKNAKSQLESEYGIQIKGISNLENAKVINSYDLKYEKEKYYKFDANTLEFVGEMTKYQVNVEKRDLRLKDGNNN